MYYRIIIKLFRLRTSSINLINCDSNLKKMNRDIDGLKLKAHVSLTCIKVYEALFSIHIN